MAAHYRCVVIPARPYRSKDRTHLAIQEALDGKVVDWMEKVSYEEYAAAVSRALMSTGSQGTCSY